MPMPGVDFFYGLGSRYSYLASTQVERIEQETGCHVTWRPLSSTDLMAASGHNPFEGEPVSGQYEWTYRQRDAEAWAAYYGVPYREPERFRTDPRHLAEACIAAGRFGRLVEYSRAMFTAIFVEGWLIDEAGLDSRLGRAGDDHQLVDVGHNDVLAIADCPAEH